MGLVIVLPEIVLLIAACLALLVEGDPRLRNEYAAIVVSPERHPHVAAEAARRLVAWLRSEEGRAAIAGFRVAGEQLFHPVELAEPPDAGARRRAGPA